ncbi:unnamed protein product, partial [Mesorhabditis belari]|uniref:BPTI/Kunitz inhibitor domain-containing protein n=1 Tax=Mesorhabditis belari TaxID=2138241 RepID=A0AAF3EMU8_9BILA
MERFIYLSAFILLSISSVKAGCSECKKSDPPGVEGFHKDKTGNSSAGCLIRLLTCNQPNYVIYKSPSGTVGQADPSLVLVCNENTQWETRDEKWIVDSVDCHSTTEMPKPKEACQLDGPIVGPCKAAFPSWYFDKGTRKCIEFTYGGCQGNENRWRSKETCERDCLDKN